jgi:hypothetical protein
MPMNIETQRRWNGPCYLWRGMDCIADFAKTVLVVEDSANDAYLLEWAIRNTPNPLSFQFVHDGEQAMSYLKGEGEFNNRANIRFLSWCYWT